MARPPEIQSHALLQGWLGVRGAGEGSYSICVPTQQRGCGDTQWGVGSPNRGAPTQQRGCGVPTQQRECGVTQQRRCGVPTQQRGWGHHSPPRPTQEGLRLSEESGFVSCFYAT